MGQRLEDKSRIKVERSVGSLSAGSRGLPLDGKRVDDDEPGLTNVRQYFERFADP